MNVSVVLPTYNERENLALLVPRLRAALAACGVGGEILVIDDASPDGTAALARTLGDAALPVRVLERPGKMGVGSARDLGFREARHEVVLSMEADNTHDPAHIPAILREIERGADLVIGSRYVAGGRIENWPASRRLLSALANGAMRAVGGGPVRDYTSGFRAFRRDLYPRLGVRSRGFAFNTEFVWACLQRGLLVREVPIRFSHRTLGRSKMRAHRELGGFLLLAARAGGARGRRALSRALCRRR